MTLMVKMSKVVKEPKTSVLVAGFEQAYQASNERVDSARWWNYYACIRNRPNNGNVFFKYYGYGFVFNIVVSLGFEVQRC